VVVGGCVCVVCVFCFFGGLVCCVFLGVVLSYATQMELQD